MVIDSVNLPEINDQIINDLIQEHKTVKLPKYRQLMNYYKAKHNVLERLVKDESKANNKLINDYPGYIIDTIQGYFIGVPVKYTSNSKTKLLDELKDIFDENNEEDHNAELAKYMGILGEAFELIYMNEESKIRLMRLPNEETILVFDSFQNRSVQLGLRYYTLYDRTAKKDVLKVEIYYKDRVEYYIENDGHYVLEKTLPHYFGKVPIIYYNNNEDCIGDFEKVLSLVDDYDLRVSDNSNELEDFRNSYLKIKNMSGVTSDDLMQIKRDGAFRVDGDGDVGFVEKNVNDSFAEHHLERLDKNIHKFSKVPDLSDESFAGNLSGVAIKYKLWPIEQVATCKERKFKTALRRRIKLICKILDIQGKRYDWKDINITFKRNMPANILELSQTTANLKGTVSDETLLAQIPFVDDPALEIERIRQAEAESLPYSSTFRKSNR